MTSGFLIKHMGLKYSSIFDCTLINCKVNVVILYRVALSKAYAILEKACLPEWFESDRASPHHHGKLAVGRNHFPLVKGAQGPINIALICMSTGDQKKGLSFNQGPKAR